MYHTPKINDSLKELVQFTIGLSIDVFDYLDFDVPKIWKIETEESHQEDSIK